MAVLIIGASGYIGSRIHRKMKEQKNKNICIGTRYSSSDPELIPFDMQMEDVLLLDERMPNEDKYALICSGDGNIESCLRNRERVYEKNVTATLHLIRRLKDLNYHITFLSTDNVFDGEKGNYTEEDAANPINEYGKMKKEVEQYLLKYVPKSCVMRLGKITGDFSRNSDLLIEWYKKAQSQEVISCIKGNVMTLTHADDIANCYALIVRHTLTGIYHTVSNEIDTRYGFCQRFLNHRELLKKRAGEVLEEKDISQFHFLEHRPLNISMDHSKFVSLTGYQFMTFREICDRFEAEYEILD